MELLDGEVRAYAWGSRTVIAELLGNPVPSPHPEAELWLGAHPASPSRLRGPGGTARPLGEVIAGDPVAALGADCARRYDGRLPFLLKLLAVEQPLSLQAHPGDALARRGHAAEEAAGIARSAAQRNYPDPTGKPELVCALSEFHALAGFREPRDTLRLLRSIETPLLAAYTETLAARPGPEGLRALFRTWASLPRPQLEALLGEVLSACAAERDRRGEFAGECAAIAELGDLHPGDAGVLAALLLERTVLHPGEALYLPPGTLHLYLHGNAMEIQANSDNVLRGGLTSKHVDTPELLRVVDFTAGPRPVLRGQHPAGQHPAGQRPAGQHPAGQRRSWHYPTEAAQFALTRVDWAAGEDEPGWLPGGGARIVLCTAGSVLLAGAGGRAGEVALKRGGSAWLPARDPGLCLVPGAAGQAAQAFCATTGTP